MTEVVHACPPEGSGVTPCCGLPPFELPRTDRLTLDAELVSCRATVELLRSARTGRTRSC